MRILILGGLGMIGHQLYKHLSQEFNQVKVCIRSSSLEALKYGIFDPIHLIDNVDLLHDRTLEITLKNVNPDIIINCAGSGLIKTKKLQHSEIIELNALFPYKLYDWCRSHSAFLIHFSNDEVFAGRDLPYDEESIPDCLTIYGRAKALGEINGPQSLTLRASYLGPELGRSTEYFSRLCKDPKQSLTVSKTNFYSGVSTLYLAEFVADLLRKNLPLSGLYQVASQLISEYDLLQLFNTLFNWNLKLIEIPGSSQYQKILNNQKLLRIWPHQPPKWNDMIFGLYQNYQENLEYRKTA